MKDLHDMLVAVFAPVVAALQSIAKSLEHAKVTQVPVGTPPAAAPVVAPPAAKVDDMGLGLDEPVAVEHTAATLKAYAQTVARAKGRPHIKVALTAVGAESLDDVKKEHYAKFVGLLDAPVADAK